MKTMSKLSAIIFLSLISFTVKSQMPWSTVGVGSTRPVYSLLSQSTNSMYIGTYDNSLATVKATLLKWNGTSINTELSPATSYGPYFSTSAGSNTVAATSTSGSFYQYSGSWTTYTTTGLSSVSDLKYFNSGMFILNSNLQVFMGNAYMSIPGVTFAPTNPSSNIMTTYTNNLHIASKCFVGGNSYLMARYNGSSLVPVGGTVTSTDRADGVAVYTSTAAEFYVTSKGTNTVSPVLRKLNGSTWVTVDASLYGQPGICVYNNKLYYAVSTGLNSNSIVIKSWDGTTSVPVATVMSTSTVATVNAMTVHNNELYVGGCFNVVISGTNSASCSNVIKYTAPVTTGITEQNTVDMPNVVTKVTDDAIIVDFEKITPIYVYDVTGKIVYSGKSNSHTVYVPNGMYFVTGEFKTVKIIK